MQIYNVSDGEFRQYGRVIEDVSTDDIMAAMENTSLPDDVVYVPGDKELEDTAFAQTMENVYYGGYPVQVGYCNGHNQKLNALEYHRSSEVNVACTDMILLLGRQQDIEADYTYDTGKVQAFLVKKGTAVEIYATTLHYAPCGVDGSGFRCVVVLPKGTNYDLTRGVSDKSEDRLLTAVNKWLIAHEEAGIEGAFNGLKGTNPSV